MTGNGVKVPELTAILIAPDRNLAAQFTAGSSRSRGFQMLAEFKAYPTPHTLEIRLRQVRPDVVLLDVGTDTEAATELVRFVCGLNPPVQVVGLHSCNDPNVLLTCLRAGASEFLYAPFDNASQEEAVSRLIRLRRPEAAASAQPGTVLVFSTAKPGSGASTLAIQTAKAVRRLTSKRVLLADFDLTGGSVGFYSRVNVAGSILDLVERIENVNASLWAETVADMEGVDVLTGPAHPYTGRIDPARLMALLEYMRLQYDWVLIDLPVIFERISLTALSHADRALLVSTPELPSLHLTRKAVQLLDQLGFPKDRFQVLVNRTSRREEMSRADMEKLLNCPVCSRFPNDYFSLNRLITLGQPLDQSCELSRGIEQLARDVSGVGVDLRRSPAAMSPS